MLQLGGVEGQIRELPAMLARLARELETMDLESVVYLHVVSGPLDAGSAWSSCASTSTSTAPRSRA
jgi:hypothetical protein